MNKKIVLILIILVTGMLTACGQIPSNAGKTPVFEIINLQITPELKHWQPKISQCAEAVGDIGIYSEILIQDNLNTNQTDLVLRLGQRERQDPYVSVMGTEEIVIVTGKEVPIETLSIDSLQAIFSGDIRNWGDIPEVKQQQMDINQPIQTFSYPQGNILRQFFTKSYLDGDPIYSDPMIYATPGGMAKLIREYPYGIGYLLRSQITEEGQQISITDSDQLSAEQYVLAITPDEPQGKLKQFLLCLQNAD